MQNKRLGKRQQELLTFLQAGATILAVRLAPGYAYQLSVHTPAGVNTFALPPQLVRSLQGRELLTQEPRPGDTLVLVYNKQKQP